jgi:glycosyltransferase involved in cell wall biosynthesis
VTAVHQFHPGLAPGDAVSDHIFAVRRYARTWGHRAETYAVDVEPGTEGGVLPYRRLFRTAKDGELLVLHLSQGHEVFDQVSKLPGRRVLVYHNVTPPAFLEGIDPQMAAHARLGLRQLETLASRVELAIGVSEFNRKDLETAGFTNTAHVPILIDWAAHETPPDSAVLARWSGVRTKLLFVGRIAPSKRQDDLIRMLAYYRRCIDPEAHLMLVGSYRDQPQYYAALCALRSALDLDGVVHFTGSVSLAARIAYYHTAACFVSVSEHEGFGVPFLEAMRFRVPVVAYDAAAVGETVADAGLLLYRRDLAEVAEACALAIERADLRQRLVQAGLRRVSDFATDRVAARTREVLRL